MARIVIWRSTPAEASAIGLGVVVLGVAAGFAATAASSWDDAGCSGGICGSLEAQMLSEDANRNADIATGLVVSGGVVTAAGVAILIAAALGDTSSEKVAGRWTPTGRVYGSERPVSSLLSGALLGAGAGGNEDGRGSAFDIRGVPHARELMAYSPGFSVVCCSAPSISCTR